MKIFKKVIKWLLLALVIVVVVLFSLWLINAPEELTEKSYTKARLDKVDYSVAEMPLEITDLGRATQALGDFDGDDKRVLKGKVWFPEETSTTHPLIIYSHGFAGEYKENSRLIKYLVRNGYVVAAVNFPLSGRRSLAGVPQLLDVVNQPGDVSAVIDHLLNLNKDPDSDLHQHLDPNKIGSLGLSLGGLTTALASFHPDLKDTRIKAAVMMAPPLGAFSESFFASNTSVKSLLISGSFDRVVPEPSNATQIIDRHPYGWFISLDKGTHLGFADVGNALRWTENPDNVGCALMNVMLSKLELPERWSAVIPNTGGVMRDIDVDSPCPELSGESMNPLKQQWLTRVAVGMFFDMHFQSRPNATSVEGFLTEGFSVENPEVKVSLPQAIFREID